MHPTTTLTTGAKIPLLGIGTYKVPESAAETVVRTALDLNYRHIDTAALYANEAAVGRAIRDSKIPRDQIFLTTKLWTSDIRAGYEGTLKAFDKSLKNLATDYVDLYLIHWPVKSHYKEAWRALEHLHATGRAKAIGVSNFLIHHLEDLANQSTITPANNQVEFHPRLQQKDLLAYNREHKITHTAWAPLMQGKIDTIPELQHIAHAHSKSPAQITLRWMTQQNIITIPKSTNPGRIQSNAEIFDFTLTSEEMTTISNLDTNTRLGAHPDTFTF